MSTAEIYYGDVPLTFTSEGRMPAATVESDLCCPPALCVPACETVCSFLDVLPTGPLWDRAKMEARQLVNDQNCEGPYDPECLSMVWYGVYGGTLLHHNLQNIIWPGIREASPLTAVTTIDDWLLRCGWEDCYAANCRSVVKGQLSPYETPGGCDPIFCPPSYSDAFTFALKHAILRSLQRVKLGTIKTLDGLNWVIEPLGAVLTPQFGPDVCLDPEDPFEYPCFCNEVELAICNSAETLYGGPGLACGERNPEVSAMQPYQCNPGDPILAVYPGVLAAECIVRSMLPRKCPNIVFRCPEQIIPA